MRDDEDGASLHEFVHTLLYEFFSAGVDRTRRFVENEDGRIGNCGTRDCDKLALTLREVFAVACEHRIVAVGQVADEIVRICEFCGVFDFLVGCVEFAEPDIVGNRPRKEVRILQNHSHRTTQIVLFDLGDIDIVVSDLSVVYVVEAVDEICDGGFACAR